MSVLVAYASKYGATKGIAERIGAILTESGQDVRVAPVVEVSDPAAYDAFVIGSAAYRGGWMSEAAEFVRRHVDLLADSPVWLFSCGPLGTDLTDAEGHDVRVLSEPREFAEFTEAVLPVDRQVFFGALDPSRLSLADRLIRRVPAGRRLLPEGDFRDWAAVEEWARAIAAKLPAWG